MRAVTRIDGTPVMFRGFNHVGSILLTFKCCSCLDLVISLSAWKYRVPRTHSCLRAQIPTSRPKSTDRRLLQRTFVAEQKASKRPFCFWYSVFQGNGGLWVSFQAHFTYYIHLFRPKHQRRTDKKKKTTQSSESTVTKAKPSISDEKPNPSTITKNTASTEGNK